MYVTSPTQLPAALTIASSTFMPSSNHPHWQQHHYKTHACRDWNQAATTISKGSYCANVPQAWQSGACIGNSERGQHHFETNKMGRFLWERPLHTSGQQGRIPGSVYTKSLEQGNWQKIKAGIRRIDPVVGMENWEIRIEGLHRKFKGSYLTQLVLFKVQNDLIAKNLRSEFHNRWETV